MTDEKGREVISISHFNEMARLWCCHPAQLFSTETALSHYLVVCPAPLLLSAEAQRPPRILLASSPSPPPACLLFTPARNAAVGRGRRAEDGRTGQSAGAAAPRGHLTTRGRRRVRPIRVEGRRKEALTWVSVYHRAALQGFKRFAASVCGI